MASYFLISSGSTPTIGFVLTSSFGSNNNVNYSASLTAWKPSPSSIWYPLTQSVFQFNSMVLCGYNVTESIINNVITGISSSTGFSIPSASNAALNSFVSGSSLVDLFASCSITLT